jgi:hypothetical protein
MGMTSVLNRGIVLRSLVIVVLGVGAMARYRHMQSRAGGVAVARTATPSAVPPSEASPPTDNPILETMFREDQADRLIPSAKIDWPAISARDKQRRIEVARMRAAGQLNTSVDHSRAAMIYQHGPALSDWQMAHELANRAFYLDVNNREARWLIAATKDRELVHLGQPQRYGTQYHQVRKGFWELYPVDPSVTDDERFRYGISDLATMRSQIAILNAGGHAPLLSP